MVFTSLSLAAELKTGPFEVLARSVIENRKIRVYTRSFNHIRGVCTGYVVVYDKHFNLVSTPSQ